MRGNQLTSGDEKVREKVLRAQVDRTGTTPEPVVGGCSEPLTGARDPREMVSLHCYYSVRNSRESMCDPC